MKEAHFREHLISRNRVTKNVDAYDNYLSCKGKNVDFSTERLLMPSISCKPRDEALRM